MITTGYNLRPILKYLSFCLTSILLLQQCASIQSPSGGEKDVDPPKVIRTIPEQNALNANPTRIEIEFDEYFVQRNLSNELLISPPLHENPIISQKGKRLFIDLQEELSENKTYTLNFGKGIADLHEGNIIESYSLVFSTGPTLDSLFIKGTLSACPQQGLPEGLIAAAYEKNNLAKDSTIFLSKPNYFSVPNLNGDFHIEKMKAGNYEIIAFEDVNGNYQFDGFPEHIAFQPNTIALKDSSNTNMWLFQEEEKLKVLDQKNKGSYVKWVFNKNTDSYKIDSEPSVDFLKKMVKDSLFIWPKEAHKDSILFLLNLEESKDTALYILDTIQKSEIRIISPSNDYVKKGSRYKCQTSAPITEVMVSKVQLESEGIAKDFQIHQTDFELSFEFEYEENQSYQLTFDEGALKGFHHSKNDSTVVSFFTKEESALSGLVINLETESKDYFIELLKNGEVCERVSSGMPLRFNNLLPENYELRLIIDTNKDGKWTAGNYLRNLLPEEVYYYGEVLNLRANWELEIDWTP